MKLSYAEVEYKSSHAPWVANKNSESSIALPQLEVASLWCSTNRLYAKISDLTLGITNKKIKISKGEKEFKPGIYISSNAKDKIQSNYYLKVNGLIIK